MADINTQAIISIVQPFILDVAAVAFAVIAGYLNNHIKNAKLREALEAAIQRGAGGVYEALVAQGASVANIPVKNEKIATAVNSLMAAYPTSIATFGVTPETLHEMVRKDLGTLLASDPNTTVLPPVPASPVASFANAIPIPTTPTAPSAPSVALVPAAVPVVAVPANPTQVGST